MNIGMVIHSATGNTLSVAKKLEEKLVAAGNTVTVHHLQPIGDVPPGAKDVQFQALPELDACDALVMGAPVNAFSLAAAMAGYLRKAPSLAGKKTTLLVTQQFPYAWLGGNRAVRQMKAACEGKGATVTGSGIVHWGRKDREEQIVAVVESLAALFG